MAERIKIVFAIATYNRPDMLLSLLKDIEREVSCSYKVLVYNDGSKMDYADVKSMKNVVYKKLDHHGKRYYYKLNQRIYKDLKKEDFKYFIHLADDMRLVEDFQKEAISRYKASGADVLNLFVTTSLRDQLHKKVYSNNGHSFIKKRWVDGCYITIRGVLSKHGFKFPAVSDRWFTSPNCSSGCGTALTLMMKRGGTKVVISEKSLVMHNGDHSVMSPDKIRKNLRKAYV